MPARATKRHWRIWLSTCSRSGYRPLAVSSDVIEENHRNLPEQLAALRFYDPARRRPTHAALLLFGKDPLSFVPGAYIQYVRYEGLTLADEPSRDRRFSGDLLSVLRGLDQLAEDVAEGRPLQAQGLGTDGVFLPASGTP